MQKINWGIIGCGDVTEVKSGPAFNKVPDSSLVAVMRRDETKCKDYASRHAVPKWYMDADRLINDPEVNAIYIATPPSSHEFYTLAALQAGKPVYVEKPMTLNEASARKMATYAKEQNGKLVIAHYRRAQPLFKKIKQLLDEKLIGETRFARIELYKAALTQQDLSIPRSAWRVDAATAGGGLFHDLAPHQLDILYHFFGKALKCNGIALNQANAYAADDTVAGTILFESGVLFNGLWNFNINKEGEKDTCLIVGTKGRIEFSFFNQQPIVVTGKDGMETIAFDPLAHVQQPMIGEVVNYFLGRGANPCSGEEGADVMRLIDQFTSK